MTHWILILCIRSESESFCKVQKIGIQGFFTSAKVSFGNITNNIILLFLDANWDFNMIFVPLLW